VSEGLGLVSEAWFGVVRSRLGGCLGLVGDWWGCVLAVLVVLVGWCEGGMVLVRQES
jgi:hypothetical protein